MLFCVRSVKSETFPSFLSLTFWTVSDSPYPAKQWFTSRRHQIKHLANISKERSYKQRLWNHERTSEDSQRRFYSFVLCIGALMNPESSWLISRSSNVGVFSPKRQNYIIKHYNIRYKWMETNTACVNDSSCSNTVLKRIEQLT